MEFWDIYKVVVAGVFALIFGSFLNCVAIRICRREDFIRGRSRCPLCGHELGAFELIPVISFLLQKGRCRWCNGRISLRYPISEICFCLLIEGIILRYGTGALSIRDAVLTGALFTAALVDIDVMRIPDGCIAAGIIAWIIALPFMGYGLSEIIKYLAAGAGCMVFMLVIALLVERVLGKEALGGGDIKLFALLGLYLGPMGAYWLVLMSSILGLVMACIMRLCKTGYYRGTIPFGPAVCLSGYILMLFGDDISSWYIHSFTIIAAAVSDK